jgi:type II secretory pathway component HofQ
MVTCLSLLFLGLGFVLAPGVGADEGKGELLVHRLRDKTATVRGENLQVNLLLRGICRQANVNVIVDESIDDTISLDLEKVSLYDVFHVIIDAKKLRFHESNKTLIVEKADALKKDQRDLVMVRLCSNFGDVAQHLKELEVVKSETGTMTVSSDGNCMIVKDHQENVECIKELLAELDLPVPQVHIKARIVTIDKSVSTQLGIKWDYTELTRSPANTLNAATDLSVVNPTTNILFGFIRDNWTLETELSAMQEKKQLQMLSSPRIVVLNGQKAEIKQGKEVPYETTGTTDIAASTSFREALLSLTVIPKILHNNFLRLDVKVTNDSIDENHSVESQPLLNRQEIQTNLFLEDGVTVVIGGILAKGSDLANQEVPWLSEMPLVGNLFKNKDELERTYELLVFLTPTIIRDDYGVVGRKLSVVKDRELAGKKAITVPLTEQGVRPQSAEAVPGQVDAHNTEQDPFALEGGQVRAADPEQNVKTSH